MNTWDYLLFIDRALLNAFKDDPVGADVAWAGVVCKTEDVGLVEAATEGVRDRHAKGFEFGKESLWKLFKLTLFVAVDVSNFGAVLLNF